MDLLAVRTFVAIAGAGQFQAAADDLEVTQQAVSKRIAALEKELGVRLFSRTPRGAALTAAGRAMFPHAREMLLSAERMMASVQPAPLRVDVVSRRIGPGALLRDFHKARPETKLDVVTLFDFGMAVAALVSGEIDATFRLIPGRLPTGREVGRGRLVGEALPGSAGRGSAAGAAWLGKHGIAATRALDEPSELLVGPGHPLAEAEAVTPAELAGHPIWIPGIAPGTEWAAYYEELAAAFGLTIGARGPNSGTETMLDALAADGRLATLVTERTWMAWPADYGLRRIPVRDPAPLYPHSLLWREGDSHPGLAALRDFLRPVTPAPGTWLPSWAV